jgi:Tfp pilus assembly protein PilO
MKTINSTNPLKHKNFRRFPPINLNFDIQIRSKKTASYFTLTISLLSLSFFGIFAIRPTISTAVSLNKKIQDLKKLNIKYEEKIGSLIRAQTEYEKIRNDLPLIDIAIPKNASFNKLVGGIERYADTENIILNQLQIDTVPISTLSATGKLFNYGFNIQAVGNYQSLQAFINHLLNWRRIAKINSLDFTKEVSSPGANLKLVIKGITYYEP